MRPDALPTPAACEFLLDLGKTAPGWTVTAFARAFKDGTFSHVDGIEGSITMRRRKPWESTEVHIGRREHA
jgi:hypothetical protein